MYLLNMEFVTNICGELRNLHKKTDKNIDKRREQVIIEIKKFALTAAVWEGNMAEQYTGMAIGMFELDSECICFVALDAAAKAANVKIQAVERNRLSAGACVKMRGTVSDVKAAMEAALETARPLAKIVSHNVIAAPSEDTETAIAMTIGK